MPKQKKKPATTGWWSKLDAFGTPYEFSYINGETELNTRCGACLFITLSVLVMCLFIDYVIIMVLRKDVTIFTNVDKDGVGTEY